MKDHEISQHRGSAGYDFYDVSWINRPDASHPENPWPTWHTMLPKAIGDFPCPEHENHIFHSSDDVKIGKHCFSFLEIKTTAAYSSSISLCGLRNFQWHVWSNGMIIKKIKLLIKYRHYHRAECICAVIPFTNDWNTTSGTSLKGIMSHPVL